MNTTKAKRRLVKEVEQDSYLDYVDGTRVAEDADVIVYGDRRDRGKQVTWRVQEVVPADEGFSIEDDAEEKPGNHQLVLRGRLRVSEAVHGHDYEFTDVEVQEVSPIDKCKEDIKQKVVQLCRLGWPNVYLIAGTLTDIDSPYRTDADLQPVTEDIIKITTIRGRGKTMHLGRSNDDDYIFKLGVNWWDWHHKSPTRALRSLSHELIHCRHMNHEETFFRAHAQFIANLTATDQRKQRVERLFDGDINWNKLKTMVMKGVHNQPDDIDVSGYPNRREACNAVVEELEDILDYEYAVGRTFHTHPPTDRFRSRWAQDYIYSDDDEYESLDDARPEHVEDRTVVDLDVPGEYSDAELYEYLQTTLKEEDDRGLAYYVYDEADLPVVDDGTVIENETLAALFARMINDTSVITEDGFDSQVTMPVILQDAGDSGDTTASSSA